jgi:MEMO1 family protein
MRIRQPAVAGLFYERDPERLRRDIAGLLQGAAAPSPCPAGLIVPHAGYIYSGAVAAAAYSALTPLRQQVQRVILLGPAHRVYLRGMALPRCEAFATPLGEVPLDTASIQRALQHEWVQLSDAAHREEHSLEVQLPFLQSVLASFSLVPLLVGDCDPVSVAEVIDTLWLGDDTLLVVSTDLSHFHPYDSARRIDAATCERILHNATDLDGEEACGARPLNGLMCSSRASALQVELLAACNSGDTAGDREQVVGYGSFLLH